MLKNEVVIDWSEEEACVAEVPELPSCAADSQTYGEAFAVAEVVIQEWLETARGIGPANSSALRPHGICLVRRLLFSVFYIL